MPSFLSDGLTLNYIEEGAGEPVLLIHGFASNLTVNWKGTSWVGTLVKAGFRVVAFDHRGHGESEKIYDMARYTVRDMAGDALALLDHLGIARADLIGYSMGARVAGLIAVEHAERARSLVLGGMGGQMFSGVSKSEEIAQALEAPHRDDVTDAYARTFRVFAESTRGDLKALAAVSRSPRMPLTREMLARIKCPTLVAVGTLDKVAGDPHELAAAIPGAEVLPIPERDHNRSVGDKVFKEGVLAFLGRRA